MSGQAIRVARAFPIVFRIGALSAIAYRAEFIVWFFAYSMPLIMLALWTAVAREGPVGRFDAERFQAYFMTTLLVRLLTGCWVAWELTWEIRQGTLAQRMLKPFPPLLAHFCENAGAVPLRLLLVSPIFAAILLWLGPGIFTSDPVQLAIIPLTLVGSFCIMFLAMVTIGTLALWWDSSLAVVELWLGFYMVLSGYVIPLELFPERVQAVVAWLPYRYLLSFPVENALGFLDRAAALRALAAQWAWVGLLLAAASVAWRAGRRRFAAFGG